MKTIIKAINKWRLERAMNLVERLDSCKIYRMHVDLEDFSVIYLPTKCLIRDGEWHNYVCTVSQWIKIEEDTTIVSEVAVFSDGEESTKEKIFKNITDIKHD